MRKIRITTILLLSFMLVLGMSQAVFAQSTPVDGGTYTFDGNSITYEAGKTTDTEIEGLEPGDDVTITFTYKNDSPDTTYWYLENTILQTLEQESEASGGGYSYILKDGTTEIFNSDAIGGEDTPSSSGINEGLLGVNDAIKGDSKDQWFFVRELGAGDSGETTLYVALDGESQANSYEQTNGKLQVNYAVEKQPPGEDIIINNPGTTTKTGDSFNPLYAILALTAALLAMLLAVLSYFKDRKDGEEA